MKFIWMLFTLLFLAQTYLTCILLTPYVDKDKDKRKETDELYDDDKRSTS